MGVERVVASTWFFLAATCLSGCIPIAFFSMTSAVSGVSGHAEIAERVTQAERNEIVDMAIERMDRENKHPKPKYLVEVPWKEAAIKEKTRKILGVNHRGM